MAAVLQGLARLSKTSPTFLSCTSAHHNYVALCSLFLPLTIKTRSKPIMVVAVEVVELVIVLSIVTILVDYLPHTS